MPAREIDPILLISGIFVIQGHDIQVESLSQYVRMHTHNHLYHEQQFYVQVIFFVEWV